MSLFKRKPRTNHKADTQNRQEDAPSNIANSPFQLVARGPAYLMNTDMHPHFLERGKPYCEALPSLADQLDWFGQEPFNPAKTVSRQELKDRALPAIRRVLVSFQVGRPVIDIAARVPCSPRTVYEILNELFYRWNSNLATWIELGLVTIWDAPKISFDSTRGGSFERFGEDAAPVFCLMCHRPIDHALLNHRDHDSTLEQTGDGRYWSGIQNHATAQGHLISHFYLGGRPRPNEPYPLEDNLYSMFGGLAGKLNAARWKERVPPGAVIESQKWRNQPPAPVFQGKSPTRESVIQFYRGLL
jgi:hypothetical protein